MVGTTVGPYQIVDRLGAGGMGEVFLGHDPRLQRKVALKRLLTRPQAGTDARARVLREARAAARLNHPNIAAVHDVLEQHGDTFIVMEYVEGESLATRLVRGVVPPDTVRDWGRQLASALAAAHAQGVVHRDLKPANIHVGRDGVLKVLDFGVAKLSAPLAVSGDSTAVQEGEPTLGGNPGTPIYMAPEQLFNGEVDARSDIFSAGAILFELATGRRPYAERGAVAVALAMSSSPAPPAASINPNVPQDLSDAIAKALERDPGHRYQSAIELEHALGGGAATAGEPFRPKRWRRIAGVVAALVLLAAIAAAIWPRLTRQAPPTREPRRMVAVLPLENLSGDRSKDYLGAGVAETLTMALSKVPTLTVLSRTEVMEALRRDHDIRNLARALDVSFVVDGSIQAVGDSLRITLRLVRPDGTVAWSDAYEAETAALFSLHRTMATDVVDHVPGQAASRVDLSVPTTAHVDALTAYWQGRAALDRAVSQTDFADALASFRRAVAIDPGFALGYAGVADTLWQQYQVTHDALLPRQALEAGVTAVMLDPNQPTTRVAVATVYQGMGQNEAAEDQLRRAIEMQPSSDDAHRILARVLAAEGKPEEAVRELQQAIAYRPRRAVNHTALGALYFQVRRLPDSARSFQAALEISPDDPRALLSLGAVYVALHDYERAIEMFERSNKITPTGLALSNLGTAYYRLGRFDAALKAYQAALPIDPQSPWLHGNLGDTYLRLRRSADATREFTTAREMALRALSVNRSDARTMSRVAAFEAKLGLADEAVAHATQAVALAQRDPEVQYNQSVVFALIGRSSDAMRSLKQAVSLGYSASDAKDDYDLASISQLAEFNVLVGSAQR